MSSQPRLALYGIFGPKYFSGLSIQAQYLPDVIRVFVLLPARYRRGNEYFLSKYPHGHQPRYL
jgi:hypothetical protein